MTQLRFKQPCSDCPFRRKSAPGWTGASGPEWFVDAALSDFPNDCPCHQTVDYENSNWKDTLDESCVCAGALIFAKNNCKLPRDHEAAEMVGAFATDRENVFSTRAEFVEHHRSLAMIQAPTQEATWIDTSDPGSDAYVRQKG